MAPLKFDKALTGKNVKFPAMTSVAAAA